MTTHYRIVWKSGTRTESTSSWAVLLQWLRGYRINPLFDLTDIEGVESFHTPCGPWVMVRSHRHWRNRAR
jgi:hypothetical protein